MLSAWLPGNTRTAAAIRPALSSVAKVVATLRVPEPRRAPERVAPLLDCSPLGGQQRPQAVRDQADEVVQGRRRFDCRQFFDTLQRLNVGRPRLGGLACLFQGVAELESVALGLQTILRLGGEVAGQPVLDLEGGLRRRTRAVGAWARRSRTRACWAWVWARSMRYWGWSENSSARASWIVLALRKASSPCE